jgi:protein kinase
MNRYELQERLGDGTFGEVTKARNLKTNEVVAVKKLKALFPTWEQCLQLRELKSLRVLRHENIVQLKEVIRDKEELYYIFEFMETSLFKVMRGFHRSSSSPPRQDEAVSSGTAHAEGPWFSEAQIQSILFQLFRGLAHMHKHGFFHRDIKPENLLCQDDVLKIADLGQAREIRSLPPFTDYVATRWYRSPELLLRSTTYNSPIDMWACGCIMVELYLRAPLFPGTSEADQLCRIAKILGSPTKETWLEGVAMANHVPFKIPKCPSIPWTHVLPASCSKASVQLIQDLLQFDPSKRLTAAQALQHRFFDQHVPRPQLTGGSTVANRDGGGSPRRSEPKSCPVGQMPSSDKAEETQSPETAKAWRSSVRDAGDKGLSPGLKDWKDSPSYLVAAASCSAIGGRVDDRAEAKADTKRLWKSPSSSVAMASASVMLAGDSASASSKLLDSFDYPEELADNEVEEDTAVRGIRHLSSHTHRMLSRENSLQDLLDEFFT